MVIMILAHNGLGLGHLSRALVICEALTKARESPVIFTQGVIPSYVEDHYPTVRMSGETNAALIGEAISQRGKSSAPAILIEDTHPSRIAIPSDVTAVLVVRPTSFDYLLELATAYANRYRAFLIADAPESPTWPYNEAITRDIQSWPNWHVIGPIFRSAEADELQKVRRRLKISPEDRVCVFSMGGGGQRNKGEVAHFVSVSKKIADELTSVDNKCRSIFVRGPFFPREVYIPEVFEEIQEEPFMPALLKLAHGAVIRPGYNTTWECISGATPFVPIAGSYHREPVPERLAALAKAKLSVDQLQERWLDQAWQARYKETCCQVTARWSGIPGGRFLRHILM